MNGHSVFFSLIHVTDWLPTLYAAAGGDLADLPDSIDGVNQWPSLAEARVPSNRQGRRGAIQDNPSIFDWISQKSEITDSNFLIGSSLKRN